MNNSNRKLYWLLIIASVLTVIVWNISAFLNFLNFVLPGDVLHQSILSNDNPVSRLIIYFSVPVFLCVPLILLIFCVYRLLKNSRSLDKIRKHQKNWLIIIAALNMVFYLLIGVNLICKSNYEPDIAKLLENASYSAFVKDDNESETDEYVEQYLNKYGDSFSFKINKMSRTRPSDTNDNEINCEVFENNFGVYFNLSYSLDKKRIVYDDFIRSLTQQKVNTRMKELIDDCIGKDLTLYVRWDGLMGYETLVPGEGLKSTNNFPVNATADDILAGNYGELYFDVIIFVYSGDEKVSLSKAKEMYLSILKNYCFVNMTPDYRSQTAQMKLGYASYFIYFINKPQYEKAWVNTTHPGEGDCMDSYASIGCGSSFGNFSKISEDPLLNPEQIYEAVKQYLDDNYHDEHWK